MSNWKRLPALGATFAAGTFALTGVLSGPAVATTPVRSAKVIGELGIEGGAYPGTFRPTAGTLFVQFALQPLELVKHVGRSGRIELALSPGTYTLTGCGPASSTGPVGHCGQPQTVTLTPGEKDHIQLVWLMAP